jgi:hypothetical protein
MSTLEIFNQQVKLLINELITLFPDEKDILIFQSQLELALMIDSRKALTSFLKNIYPHKEQILAENDTFFLDKSNDLENDYMAKTIHMTHLWKDRLNTENKKVVWKYFKVMCLLVDKMR